ncbi:enoyl-CoA hydratase/isomerase family protein [Dietzia sp. NPDC055343]
MLTNQRALTNVQLEDGIVWITLSNGPVNALSSELLEELTAVLDDLAASNSVDVAVLSSAFEVFSAGVDLKAMKLLSNDDRMDYFRRVGGLLSRLQSVPFWTVALVEGKAIGAGADLSLACDFVFAANDATWRFPGYRKGLRLGVKRLVARVGPSRAFRLMALDKEMCRDEAVAWGAVFEYLNQEELAAAAKSLSDCHGSPADSRLQMFGDDNIVGATEVLEKSLSERVVARFN